MVEEELHEGSSLERLRDVLVNASGQEKLADRFRALFYLKSIGEEYETDPEKAATAIKYIEQGFDDKSELLKHEMAYCLGQTKNMNAVVVLRDVLADMDQQCMVRHEAAEALGALGDQGSIELLTKYWADPKEMVEIRQTCELALERIKWEHSERAKTEKLQESLYTSIDPAPPLALDEKTYTVQHLQEILNDQDKPLFERYRAMFRLRDMGTDEACRALATAFNDPSALLKHEVAYIFGQICNPVVVEDLTKVVNTETEAPMVRHEAAEALGAIATDSVLPVLRDHLTDKDDVVRESAIVALDMYEYENSNEMEYAG